MAEPRSTPPIPFVHSTPIFCVKNGARALEFYVDVLGFEISWQWSDDEGFDGGAPTFACVRRGDVAIFLGEERQGNPGAWVMVNVPTAADVDRVCAEVRARGAEILEEPDDCSWGMREVWIKDLDGNVLRIGAPSPEAG